MRFHSKVDEPFGHYVSGGLWQELEEMSREYTARTGVDVDPLGAILFLDDLEIEKSRNESATGLYLMLANDSVEHLCSTVGVEVISVLPKNVQLQEAIDVIINRAITQLESGTLFYWPPTQTQRIFVGSFLLLSSPNILHSLQLGTLLEELGDYMGQSKSGGFGGPSCLLASHFSLTPTALFQGHSLPPLLPTPFF